MKKNVALYIFVGIVVILPYLYLSLVYKTLPQTVPTHFGFDGKPDAMGNKSSLWFILSLCAVISVLVFLLLRFLPVIDPKRKAKYSAPSFIKMGVAIVLLLAIINCIIIHSAQVHSFNFNHFFPLIFGLFFAFMGNVMHSIKPNYFAGIRTPWTLESEETWRKTHQFAGKLWFIGGSLIVVLSLLLPSSLTSPVMIGIIFIIAILPVIYSYRYFKSIHKIGS